MQSRAPSLQSSNVLRRIDSGLEMLVNWKRPSSPSLSHADFSDEPSLLLETLNLYSALFVSGGHALTGSQYGTRSRKSWGRESMCHREESESAFPSVKAQLKWYDDLMHSQVSDLYTELLWGLIAWEQRNANKVPHYGLLSRTTWRPKECFSGRFPRLIRCEMEWVLYRDELIKCAC